MKEIQLTNSKRIALVDDEVYDKTVTMKWLWTGLYVRSTSRPYTSLQNFLFGKPPKGLEWDHKNRLPEDNRRENLRFATRFQNNANRDKFAIRCTSKYKGVSLYGSNSSGSIRIWAAYIRVDGKRKHLGYFDSEEEAALVYNTAAKEFFGEFAVLNKVVPERV